MELNPNHPVTAALHDHWQKLFAIAMHKNGQKHVVITAADVDALTKAFAPHMPVVIMHDRADGIHCVLMTEPEARAYVAQTEGGDVPRN